MQLAKQSLPEFYNPVWQFTTFENGGLIKHEVYEHTSGSVFSKKSSKPAICTGLLNQSYEAIRFKLGSSIGF